MRYHMIMICPRHAHKQHKQFQLGWKRVEAAGGAGRQKPHSSCASKLNRGSSPNGFELEKSFVAHNTARLRSEQSRDGSFVATSEGEGDRNNKSTDNKAGKKCISKGKIGKER